ncbi:hypothetical protein Zmor_028539 [Zophobas morio]|jgi:hypothetical protein|uniref:Homeobox domain-containing protein n=1 Tax=Zophobas morio TaxID=2755281 RepID=A0AA38M099_9CUCU|nr:hypothetical protein Zmor_028539 [Zophobas morio]
MLLPTVALVEAYNENHMPDKKMRNALAEVINLPPRVVEIWFQNQRALQKKRLRQSGTASGTLYCFRSFEPKGYKNLKTTQAGVAKPQELTIFFSNDLNFPELPAFR